ncbi:MAG: 50S ribosomal protein L11 methyltransferase [Burkholderiaceae bacterium]
MSTDEQSSTGWVELSFVIDQSHADALSDALLEAGALSVQVLDDDAGTDAEQAVFGEPGMPAAPLGWRASRLVTLCDDEAGGRLAITQAAAQIGLSPIESISANTVAPQDWVSLTQSQFDPVAIGERLLITPTWHVGDATIAEQAGQRAMIVLDPGLAFGTGSHPTTRLCLRWLDAHDLTDKTVIDYGCGSGILAIAAAKLGAQQVCGVDIDQQALTSATDNANANEVALTVSSTADPAPEPADIVLANILASPLKVLAPLLEDLVKPGGHLVLAGLLDHQADEVAACYRQLEMSAWASEDGWTCLTGKRDKAV